MSDNQSDWDKREEHEEHLRRMKDPIYEEAYMEKCRRETESLKADRVKRLKRAEERRAARADALREEAEELEDEGF